MPQQIKGKSLSLVPKFIALDIEIIKIVKSEQEPTDEPVKQHFQIAIANPLPKQNTSNSNTTPHSTTQK